MGGVLSISGRLLAGGGRKAALDLGLSAAGVALSVAITLLVLGGIGGLQLRQDRVAWRDPLVSAPGSVAGPVALQQRTLERFGDTTIEVVRLRPLGPADAPMPPGLAQLPADGEILASPALADLLAGPQGDLLRVRLGDHVVGTLPPQSLAFDDEAFAVVGDGSLAPTAAEDLPGFDYRALGPFEPSPVAEVADFAGSGAGSHQTNLYNQLFSFGGVLLIAPSILLLGAAARFTAARRARRLAGLRLAGASPRQITAIAALESLAGAAVGVLVGVVLAAVGRVLVAGIPLAGGPFGVAELSPPVRTVVLVAVLALLVALAATLAGLRAVRASPLGVVRVVGDRRPSVLRVGAMVAVLVLFGIAAQAARGGAGVMILVVALGLVIGSVSLVGPWFTWVLGWLAARRSRRVSPLLAARAMTSDPIGAFRPATPLVFSAFVGGFLLVVTGTSQLHAVAATDPEVLVVPADTAVPAVESALQDAGVDAAVAAGGEDGDVQVALTDLADLEVARTALDPVVDPRVPLTAEDKDSDVAAVLQDVARGVWLVLVLALVQAAGATAVGAAATVLEQGRPWRRCGWRGWSPSGCCARGWCTPPCRSGSLPPSAPAWVPVPRWSSPWRPHPSP